jgi:hypothetical protein
MEMRSIGMTDIQNKKTQHLIGLNPGVTYKILLKKTQ